MDTENPDDADRQVDQVKRRYIRRGFLLALCTVGTALVIFVLSSPSNVIALLFLDERFPLAIHFPRRPFVQATAVPPLLVHSAATPVPTEAMSSGNLRSRFRSASNDAFRAIQLMQQGDCGAAQLAWDDVVRQVPEFAFAYYMRGYCVTSTLTEQRTQEEYERNLDRALSDLDQAIALGPYASGDVYIVRGVVLEDISVIQSSRRAYEYWKQLALESNRLGVANGADIAWASWSPLLDLISLGRCQEALEELEILEAASSQDPEQDGGYLTMRTRIFLCLGDYDQAYESIQKALAQQSTVMRMSLEVSTLFNLGRMDEAEAELNQMIEARPFYDGERYALRALIHFEKGEMDLMRQDLDSAHSNSWGTSPIEMYIDGMLALQAGDEAQAVGYLQQAELAYKPGLGALNDRILTALGSLNADPVVPPLDVAYQPTAHPTLAPTPTPRPETFNPLDPSQTLLRVVMEDGAGPLAVAYQQSVYIQFQPFAERPAGDVKRVTIQVAFEPAAAVHQETNWPPVIYAWDFARADWRAMGGPVPIEMTDHPGDLVAPDGSVYLLLNGDARAFSFVDQVTVGVDILKPDGGTVRLGPQDAGP